MAELKVTARGPIFDGRASAAMEDFMDAAKEEVAQEGVNLVRRELSNVLKNPTGYYESRITTELASNDRAVTDSGVVYGPWLEGTGSRNNTTRFKGYSTFRRVAQELQGKASEVAERVLPEYLRRMN